MRLRASRGLPLSTVFRVLPRRNGWLSTVSIQQHSQGLRALGRRPSLPSKHRMAHPLCIREQILLLVLRNPVSTIRRSHRRLGARQRCKKACSSRTSAVCKCPIHHLHTRPSLRVEGAHSTLRRSNGLELHGRVLRLRHLVQLPKQQPPLRRNRQIPWLPD